MLTSLVHFPQATIFSTSTHCHRTLHLFFTGLFIFFCPTTSLPLLVMASVLPSPHSPSGPVEQFCQRTRLNRTEHGCMLFLPNIAVNISFCVFSELLTTTLFSFERVQPICSTSYDHSRQVQCFAQNEEKHRKRGKI